MAYAADYMCNECVKGCWFWGLLHIAAGAQKYAFQSKFAECGGLLGWHGMQHEGWSRGHPRYSMIQFLWGGDFDDQKRTLSRLAD